MTSIIRGKVSKNKRRFVDKKNGFDLDLSYITEKIIAMGFPSENMEGLYRNNMSDVIRFLDLKHKDHYKVYNLCSERSYDHQKFYNRVEVFPFDDHNAPRFELMEAFCKNVQDWLDEHPENVAAIHCKAGKGRTGVMICAWLLYNNTWSDPEEAMQFYGAMRTFNIKGVTIPSQIRYIRYFSRSLKSGLPPLPTLRLNRIILHRDIKYENDIKFKLYEYSTELYRYQQKSQKIKSGKKKGKSDPTPDAEEDKIIFEIEDCLPLSGDIKVVFFDTGRVGAAGKVLFTFWFNTRFIVDNHLVLIKKELDKANKDKKHKVYHQDFNVELNFQEMPTQATETTSNEEIVSLKSLSMVREANTQTNIADFVHTLLKDLIGSLAAYAPNWNNINLEVLKQFASTRQFSAIGEGVQYLSQLDVGTLKNSREKLAFWLNLYHLLLLYSLITMAREGTIEELRTRYYHVLNSTVYTVSGQSFSLLEILFGCLLPSFSIPDTYNAGDDQLSTPKFPKGDVRGQWALSKVDTRVLCVLWEPFSSGSQLPLFYSLSVNEELESRTRKFLSQTVDVDSFGDVTIPKIFSLWPDVVKSGKTVVKWLAEYHPNKVSQKQLQKASKAILKFREDKFQEPVDSALLSISHLKREFVSYLPADLQQETTTQLEQEEKAEPLSRERRGASISFLDNLKHKKVSGLIPPNNHHSLNASHLMSSTTSSSSSAPSSPSTQSNAANASNLASMYSMDSLPVTSAVHNYVSTTTSITPRPALISTPSTPVLGIARLASRSVPQSNPIGSSSLSKNEIDHDLLDQDILDPLSEPDTESESEEEYDEVSTNQADHISPRSDSNALE